MRIAEIYPVQKLPRRFSVFDYLVPDDMALSRGSWVKIPFRNQELIGVVKEIHERFSPRKNLKWVKEKIDLSRLSEEEFSFYNWLAHETVQAPSSIFQAALPNFFSRKVLAEKLLPSPLTVRSSEAPYIQRMLRTVEEKQLGFFNVPDFPRMSAIVAAYAHAHSNDQIAILVPSPREAKILASKFASFEPTLLTGEEGASHRFQAWSNFREKKKRILIGTRLASLLISSNIDAIFVLRSGHESYKQSDQNPRYDARDNVKQWQKEIGCRLYFFDSAPRIEDLVFFKPDQLCLEHRGPEPQFIDLNQESTNSPHPLISFSLFQTMEIVLKTNRRILCFYNRKGQAASLRCADCGFFFPCPKCGGIFTVYETTVNCHHCRLVQPIPLSCSVCQGNRLIERGFGNQAIKQALKKIFPQASVSIIDKNNQEDPLADILMVTSYYLESFYQPFERSNFGLIANLNADLALLSPTYKSFEEALRSLEELRGLAAHEQAFFAVQSRVPDFFKKYYDQPIAVLTEELNLRQAYQDPPFVRLIKITNKEKEERLAWLELEGIMEGLKTISGVTTSLHAKNKFKKPELLITVNQQIADEVLKKLSVLPDHIIIDTKAIS